VPLPPQLLPLHHDSPAATIRAAAEAYARLLPKKQGEQWKKKGLGVQVQQSHY